MTTKLYLRDIPLAYANVPTEPSASVWLTTTVRVLVDHLDKDFDLAPRVVHTLDTAIGSGPYQLSYHRATQFQRGFLGSWGSAPLEAQTFGAGTWHVRAAPRTGVGGSTIYLGCALYVWRESAHSVVGYIYNSAASLGTAWATGDANSGRDVTFTGANVTCEQGDYLILELWMSTKPNDGASPEPLIGTTSSIWWKRPYNFELITRVGAADWTPGAGFPATLFACPGGWSLTISLNGGVPELSYDFKLDSDEGGRQLTTSGVALEFVDGQNHWIKVAHLYDLGTRMMNVAIYKCLTDQLSVPSPSQWVLVKAMSPFTTTGQIEYQAGSLALGSSTTGTTPFVNVGTVHRFIVKAVIGQVIQADYNPLIENPSNSLIWTSSVNGLIWTDAHDLTGGQLPYNGTAVEPTANSTSLVSQSAAILEYSSGTVDFLVFPPPSDPEQIGLTNYGCTGTLAIQWGLDYSTFMLSMNCPAWDIPDLTPLMAVYEVRGDDRRVPGVVGAIPYRRRYDVTEHALQMWITGIADKDGIIYEDSKEGLETNLAYLRQTILNQDPEPGMPSNGTRLAQYTTPSGQVMSASIHVLGLRISEVMIVDDHAWVNAVLQISVPAGRFVYP